MGLDTIRAIADGEERRAFTRRLLEDLHALETMVRQGAIEADRQRLGAEQELFLVDPQMRPAPVALALLERLADPDHYTTELGAFNLELNLPPLELAGDCLGRMERTLEDLLGRLRAAAAPLDVQPLLTGILPTLRLSDLGVENMTARPRYAALNRAMTELRGGAYDLYIRGLDELLLQHDSVMLEACNASFQVHLQVDPARFAATYNAAQLALAPVLAVAVNSPLLFGRQLWAETRIALFQQSVDTRASMRFLRERSPRVTFGTRWLRESVLELYREDVSRFRALVTADLDEQPLARLARGEVPLLQALSLYNGTIYRWNRACYGVTAGRPHLRIENRVLPSGPSIVDQVANAAFWYGLVLGLVARYEDVAQMMPFEEAKTNFHAAARHGMGAQLVWFGERMPAAQLVCERLLPLAREALVSHGVDAGDAGRYLEVIERRASSSRTGAQWLVRSFLGLRGQGNLAERLTALTAATIERQGSGLPVSDWEPARIEEAGLRARRQPLVEQYMTTDLFTVCEDESLDLVANLMEWRRIRHVPVEDSQHRLIGLISYRTLLRLLARGELSDGRMPSVGAVMRRDPITVSPGAPVLRAIETMRTHRISCLPVVDDGRLVGVITERDLMNMAGELLEEKLGETDRHA